MIIRSMEKKDVPEVSIIEKENFKNPWSEKAFLDTFLNKNIIYLVACEKERIIGMCGVHHILGEGEITNVAVKNSYKRQHVGEQMMTALMEKGRIMGIEEFTLEVRVGNKAAISLYEKLGFVTEGIRKNFYENPIEDALIMWKR